MLKSMTGYGGAKSAQDAYKLSVEIKSVNNRYLDTSVRLPRSFLFAEDAVKQAVSDGVDLMGYIALSGIDLVSASTGEMSKRYGFVYVDKQDDGTGTLARSKKDSFYWYQKVIRSNGADL